MDFQYKEDLKELEPPQKQVSPQISRLVHRQKITMNNHKIYEFSNKEFILNNLYNLDDTDISESIYRHINNPYQKKINLINMILDSELSIPMSNYQDIIKFFNWLSPLNNEYNLSSKDWNIKTIKYGNKEKILLQNSISKSDISRQFYKNYIDLIKKKIKTSGLKYNYFEFKSKRFNKIKDIIWVFDKN
jgi:hypothetical protein